MELRTTSPSREGINSGASFAKRDTRITREPQVNTSPDHQQARSSWNFSFLSSSRSLIRNITAVLSSTSSKALHSVWGTYHCSCSQKAPDRVNYSNTSVNIDGETEIPKTGSFQAGSNLRAAISSSLFNAMVEEDTSDKGLEQFNKDVPRCSTFNLGTPLTEGINIRYVDQQKGPHQEKIALSNFIEMVGLDNFPLARAIAGVANQTLGNTANLIYSGADPSLRSEKCIGFPSPFSSFS